MYAFSIYWACPTCLHKLKPNKQTNKQKFLGTGCLFLYGSVDITGMKPKNNIRDLVHNKVYILLEYNRALSNPLPRFCGWL